MTVFVISTESLFFVHSNISSSSYSQFGDEKVKIIMNDHENIIILCTIMEFDTFFFNLKLNTDIHTQLR